MPIRLSSRTALLVLAFGVGGLAAAGSSDAAPFLVDATADLPDVNPGDGECDGDPSPAVACTLRAAIMEANSTPSADEIFLQSSTTYTLTRVGTGDDAGDLDVTSPITIYGYFSTVKGAPGWVDGIFDVAFGGSLEVFTLTAEGGNSSTRGGCFRASDDLRLHQVEVRDCASTEYGGGISFSKNGGQLLLDRCWVHGNRAPTGGGVQGSPGSSLVILDSTISLNQASVAHGGGILSAATLFVNNSTIVGNFANGDGGGILSYNLSEISSSTIVANFCDADGNGTGTGCGLWSVGAASTIMRNSIIGKNVNWNHFEPDDCVSAVASEGYNLIGFPSTSCTGFSATTHDLLGAPLLDPQLDPLDDYGGPTPTMTPKPGSPVIDAANPAGCYGDVDGVWSTPETLLLTDQRHFPRALGGRCDIGATEFAIFVDGFESGDTWEWSNAVGS